MSDNFSDRSTDSDSSDILIHVKSQKVDSSSSLKYFQENMQEDDSGINYIITKLDKEDKYLSNFIHELEVNSCIEIFIYIFGRLFNPDLLFAFYSFLLLYGYLCKNDIYFVVKPLIHMLATFGMSQLLKYIIKRPRPEVNENIKRRHNLRKKEKNFSMPSGDSVQAGNFAIMLLTYFGYNYGFFIIPFVMFARIYYFCHYVLDTAIGAILGISISLILVYPLKCIQF